MQVYWKKVRGHSHVPGQDKELNDLTDSLAKQGAMHGTPWSLEPSWLTQEATEDPSHPKVCVVRRSKASKTSPDRASNNDSVSVEPVFTDTDLVTLQSLDPAINKMVLFLSND